MDELDDIISWHVETADGMADHRLLLEIHELPWHDDDDAAFERWLASMPARELDIRLSRLIDEEAGLAPALDLTALEVSLPTAARRQQ